MKAFLKRGPLGSGHARPDPGPCPADEDDEPEAEPPSKRSKRTGGRELDSKSAQKCSSDEDDATRTSLHCVLSSDDEGESPRTDLEHALPPTSADASAIEEYLMTTAPPPEAGETTGPEEERPVWIKGKRSIYVDAFNLALDTVLRDESHLFDEMEREVFRQWAGLHYEAQFLYVRLFLRKTAAWHRCNRLGYYADISDPPAAIQALQETRQTTHAWAPAPESSVPGTVPERPSPGESFSFADASEDHINTVREAASLLQVAELKALAKEAKAGGRNKEELIQALCRVGHRQAALAILPPGRHNGAETGPCPEPGDCASPKPVCGRRAQVSPQEGRLLSKILALLGPCIRLSAATLKLFERVHLVFYRSTEWTEKSLTAIILAKVARRSYPEYVVCRTSTIFASREHLLEYEAALLMEAEVDAILEANGAPSSQEQATVIALSEDVHPRWCRLLVEEGDREARVYESCEGAYLRRFSPAHCYTRILHKASGVLGRQKEYSREHRLLEELLEQRLFHPGRRGAWYQRKALLEEHYMAKIEDEAGGSRVGSLEEGRRRWAQRAVATCESGLQDPLCHVVYHHDLQKRLVRLEKRMRIPRRLQHDFGHVRLAAPIELRIEGVQLKREQAAGQTSSGKTLWLDSSGGACSVEEMCLSQFRAEGWKGYHAEGGIVRTLFAYLLYDMLFLPMPNVFQTAYQSCPLDLHSDAFYPARMSEINRRLAAIANGEGEQLLRAVWQRQHRRQPVVVGLDWTFDPDDLAELVRCFDGPGLAAVCKLLAEDYRQRAAGVPDLLLWRAPAQVMFVEVKSANDRLSDKQRLWIHVLAAAGISVALCNAVAREVRPLARP